MNISRPYGIKKAHLIIMSLLITIGSLTSCEKVEDDIIPKNSIDQNIVKEVIIVEAANWQRNQICCEAKLDCTILTNAVEYEFLKLYLKVPKSNGSTDIWEQLPLSDVTFRVVNHQIFVKRDKDWGMERSIFMVELRIKENAKEKSVEANSIEHNISIL